MGVINTLNLEEYNVEKIGKIELIIPEEDIHQNPISANCSVLINNKNLELNNFASKIVSNSIKAMINSIKTEDNVKTIDIDIANIEDDKLENSQITVKTNNHDVEINEFTSRILKETIYAVINSLEIDDDEINEIKIKVEE
jgi:molybdopterin-guanine dinucleotide biosynthesis protein B